MKKFFALLIAAVLAVQAFFGCFCVGGAQGDSSEVYFGVDIAYGQVADAKAALDKTVGFTNLAVIGSTGVTWFQDRSDEVYQYAYDKGYHIVSLLPSLPDYTTIGLNETEWFQMATIRWGERILGFYIGDELGGKQLDGVFQYTGGGNFSSVPGSYTEAATQFTEGVGNFLKWQKPPANYKTFTSDYALYWYDYKAGYDVVWTELGGNWSKQINIALCRGAAEAAGKEWGAIITWKYTQAPFMENGTQLYDDLRFAYDNGAKYIVIFDSDENGHSTLQAEHYEAMQQFWTYMKSHTPLSSYPKSERVGYVVPAGYGFGFRWPTDHIWGIWQPDEYTPNITRSVGVLLDRYGGKLDILLNDELQGGNNGYSELFYWNSFDPSPTPTPTLAPTPTPSPTPTATKTGNEPIGQTWLEIVVVAVAVSGSVFVLYRKYPKTG